MASANQKIQDKFISHEVNLARLQASHRKVILADLRKLEKSLIKKLQASTGETFTAARQKALLAQVKATIATSYKGIYKQQVTDMQEMVAYDLKTIAKAVNKTAQADVMTVGVSDHVIDSLVSNETILGAPLKTVWEGEASSLVSSFTSAMRQGIMAGETTDQLVRRVAGTKARDYKDGIMDPRRRAVEMRVRTSAQSILNDARMQMYGANADIIKGYQWQATLDNRTSEICMALSGQTWDLEGKPIDASDDFPGPPPAHPNCRSTLIPILKSYGDILNDDSIDEQVAEAIQDIPQATQSSMDGQVAGDLSYEDWLKGKDETFQRDVLGDSKYELWKDGKISLRDLIDQKGNPLTLDELTGKKPKKGKK